VFDRFVVRVPSGTFYGSLVGSLFRVVVAFSSHDREVGVSGDVIELNRGAIDSLFFTFSHIDLVIRDNKRVVDLVSWFFKLTIDIRERVDVNGIIRDLVMLGRNRNELINNFARLVREVSTFSIVERGGRKVLEWGIIPRIGLANDGDLRVVVSHDVARLVAASIILFMLNRGAPGTGGNSVFRFFIVDELSPAIIREVIGVRRFLDIIDILIKEIGSCNPLPNYNTLLLFLFHIVGPGRFRLVESQKEG